MCTCSFDACAFGMWTHAYQVVNLFCCDTGVDGEHSAVGEYAVQ